jgi:hypothetical protein
MTSDGRAAGRKALADSRWRAYCANLGYPDPDAATQERTIWPAGDKQTATSRTCSAFRRRGTRPVTVWMRQAVDDVYGKGLLRLPEVWSAQEKDRYLDILTERLDTKAADLSMELASSAIHEWTQRNQGRHPDFETTLRLRTAAQQNAREAIVRQDLYSKVPTNLYDQEAEPQPPPPVPAVPWERRWTHPAYRAEPSEDIEDLTDLVWPDRSAMFRVDAAYLLATRLEDGLEIPTGPHHRLARALAPQVEQELRDDGYPAE